VLHVHSLSVVGRALQLEYWVRWYSSNHRLALVGAFVQTVDRPRLFSQVPSKRISITDKVCAVAMLSLYANNYGLHSGMI
jgi:hypothetical protein